MKPQPYDILVQPLLRRSQVDEKVLDKELQKSFDQTAKDEGVVFSPITKKWGETVDGLCYVFATADTIEGKA